MKLKQLDIVCENCQCYKLDGKDVVTIYLQDISETIGTNVIQDVMPHLAANKAYFRLKNKNYKVSPEQRNGFDDRTPTFQERMIGWRDVTGVVLIYEDGSEKEICVPYDEENPAELGSPNKLQNVEIDEDTDEIIIEIFKEN